MEDSRQLPCARKCSETMGTGQRETGAMAKELPLDNVKIFEHKKCLEIDTDILNVWKIIYESIVILKDDDSGQGQFFIEYCLLICVRNYRIWKGNNWLRCRRLVDAKITGKKILGQQDISQDLTVSPYLLLSNCKGREDPLQQRNLANTTLTQGSNRASWWQAGQSLPPQQSWQQHLVWLYMKQSHSSRLWDVLEASRPGSHLTLPGGQ